MALKITKTDNKGQSVSYHRIVAFAPVFISGQESLNVNLAGYTSEAYRDAEKAASGESMQVSSAGIVLPLTSDDVYSREILYNKIKELPEFAGAEDC